MILYLSSLAVKDVQNGKETVSIYFHRKKDLQPDRNRWTNKEKLPLIWTMVVWVSWSRYKLLISSLLLRVGKFTCTGAFTFQWDIMLAGAVPWAFFYKECQTAWNASAALTALQVITRPPWIYFPSSNTIVAIDLLISRIDSCETNISDYLFRPVASPRVLCLFHQGQQTRECYAFFQANNLTQQIHL